MPRPLPPVNASRGRAPPGYFRFRFLSRVTT